MQAPVLGLATYRGSKAKHAKLNQKRQAPPLTSNGNGASALISSQTMLSAIKITMATRLPVVILKMAQRTVAPSVSFMSVRAN